MHDLERRMVNVDLQPGDEIALLVNCCGDSQWGPLARLAKPLQIEILKGARVGMVRSGSGIGTPCQLSPATHDRIWAHLKADAPVMVQSDKDEYTGQPEQGIDY